MKNDLGDIQYVDTHSVVELSDLSLVAALYCLGFNFESIDRNPKYFPKVGFIYIKNKKLQENIEAFWNGSLLIEPKSYWGAIRELKSRIRIG